MVCIAPSNPHTRVILSLCLANSVALLAYWFMETQRIQRYYHSIIPSLGLADSVIVTMTHHTCENNYTVIQSRKFSWCYKGNAPQLRGRQQIPSNSHSVILSRQFSYRYKETHHTCEDINECAEENPCRGNAFCVNSDGAFLCQCPKGK